MEAGASDAVLMSKDRLRSSHATENTCDTRAIQLAIVHNILHSSVRPLETYRTGLGAELLPQA